MPVHPVEILFGVERGQQGLRAGIVVGIVERLHRNLQQDLVTLRPRPFGELAGIRAIGRERQRHRRRQLHDGVGGLGGADAEAADHDGDDRHLGGLGAVGLGGIDRERLQAVGDHRDHAVAGFFQKPRIDPGHHGGRGVGSSALSAPSIAADRDVLPRAAGAVDDGDGLLLAGGPACLGADFAIGSESRARRLRTFRPGSPAAARRAPSARRRADRG